MVEFNSRQRSYLRRHSHSIRPSLHIGKDGVTEASVRALAEAFNTRELVKVKVQDGAPGDVREIADQLVAEVEGAEQVFTIGRTAVLYRPHPDDPEIDLDRMP